METAVNDYWWYIFAAYSVAAVVVIAMLIFTLRGLRTAQKTLKHLKQDEV